MVNPGEKISEEGAVPLSSFICEVAFFTLKICNESINLRTPAGDISKQGAVTISRFICKVALYSHKIRFAQFFRLHAYLEKAECNFANEAGY